MIKSKHFLLILPAIILIIALQLLSVEKKEAHISTYKGPSQTIISKDFTTSLSYSFRKINNQHDSNGNQKALNELEKIINDDLNYLRNSYFIVNKNLDHATTEQHYTDIQNRILQNQKMYSDMINIMLEDSLFANDNNSSSQLFALAASLPLGPSNIQNTSEKILIDLISMDRKWDEKLFKNALQFYYIQNFIKNEQNNNFIKESLDRCPDKSLKNKILLIDNEINVYSSKEKAIK